MSQRITTREMAEAVVTLRGRGMSMPKLARAVAAYLVIERRSKDLDGLVRDMESVMVERGRVEATTRSAFPLSKKSQQAIAELLKAYYDVPVSIRLDETIDSELIGGVLVNAPNVQVDLSMKHRLQQFAATEEHKRT